MCLELVTVGILDAGVGDHHVDVGQEHMVRFADLADIDVVVTDAGIEDAERAELEAHDVEVVIA